MVVTHCLSILFTSLYFPPQDLAILTAMDTKDLEVSKVEASAIGAQSAEQKQITNNKNIGTLERKLKSRHIQFLALSGAIGTGLFVGSGQVLSLAGPLSAWLAYTITGFNLFCVINSLGEMASYLPIPGAVPVYAARFVDEALGFAVSTSRTEPCEALF